MTRLAARSISASRLRDLLAAGGLDELPDVELLDRFARYGEHASFDVLLRRHGPTVLGVCRRVLGRGVDVDDAFQATFLVLVRKARGLRRGGRLGAWLYGVAVRVALKARARRARFAERHREATDLIPDPAAPAESPDWLPVLDAELAALPAKYREPLILCELQGATRADAARALGVREGTLSSRLARGRALLRRRLLKHGTLLPAGGLAALFASGDAGRAAVPAGLITRTSEAVVAATGAAAAGTVPAGAAQLTDEVLRGMMLTKLRLACGAVVAAVLVGVGFAAALPADGPDRPEKPMASPPAAAGKSQPARPAALGAGAAGFADAGPALTDREALQGLWVAEKVDAGPKAEPARVAQELAGKWRFLVAGDVWWNMLGGEAAPLLANLQPEKNPKWLDLTGVDGGRDSVRCIYELSGDRLRVCLANSGRDPRPAEFVPDDESRNMVVEFRREKMPPAAGEKALVGSWDGLWVENPQPKGGIAEYSAGTQRLEILDGYLFAFSTEKGRPDEWFGGRYTVDTTKNPKWIDVELTGLIGDKVSKLYGTYEVTNGRLKLALGPKRVSRPLELKPDNDVLFFDVRTTKEPLVVRRPAAVDVAVPVPQPGLPDLPRLPGKSALRPARARCRSRPRGRGPSRTRRVTGRAASPGSGNFPTLSLVYSMCTPGRTRAGRGAPAVGAARRRPIVAGRGS